MTQHFRVILDIDTSEGEDSKKNLENWCELKASYNDIQFDETCIKIEKYSVEAIKNDNH